VQALEAAIQPVRFEVPEVVDLLDGRVKPGHDGYMGSKATQFGR
jgi:hypothetical protein